MPTPQPATHPHKARTRLGSTLAALAALVPIAIASLFLASTGANHAATANPTTHPDRAATQTALIQHPHPGKCNALLDPLTGHMHGGCAPR